MLIVSAKILEREGSISPSSIYVKTARLLVTGVSLIYPVHEYGGLGMPK